MVMVMVMVMVMYCAARNAYPPFARKKIAASTSVEGQYYQMRKLNQKCSKRSATFVANVIA